jgi:YVTN family beta-propeller protein
MQRKRAISIILAIATVAASTVMIPFNAVALIPDSQTLNTKTLDTIASSTNKDSSQIDVGQLPNDIAVNNQTNIICVANLGSNTVSVINGTTNSLITDVHVGIRPIFVVVNPHTHIAYVANSGYATVSTTERVSASALSTNNASTLWINKQHVNQSTLSMYQSVKSIEHGAAS